MNYFEYNGVRSSDMGLRIEKKNVFSAPSYDVTFQSVPGRNGDLILPNGRYSNMQITYSVFLPAKTTAELASKITAVKNWLYKEQDSYHELKDTYDASFYRNGVFANSLDIEDELNKIGVFTVSFSCRPFRFSESGRTAVTASSGTVLANPYVIAAKPLIKINGSGTGTLKITNSVSGKVQTVSLTGIDGYVYVDSESMLCYKDSENMSSHLSGDGFPVLEYGNNTITLTGGITSAVITPRWCCL